jgi:hypothetical protein
VSGSVGEGEIVVCNGAGCIAVTNGESYYVANADTKAVLTGKKTDLPPPQPDTAPPLLTQGDTCTGPDCAPQTIFIGVQELSLAHAVNLAGRGVQLGLVPLDTVTFDANGNLIAVNSGNDPLIPLTSLGAGYPLPAFGNDGLIAWGVGLDKFGQYFHYATGIPALYGDLASLAISQPVATFDLIGASPPIALSTKGVEIGQITGGKLEARFADGNVNVSLDMNVLGNALTASGSALPFSKVSSGDPLTFGGSATCTGAVCSGQMTGFIGDKALRAGVGYSLGIYTGGVMTNVAGSAAFANTSPQ